MSQSVKTKPTRRRGADPAAQVAAASAERVKRQSRSSAGELVVGGRPSVDLLPTEVLADRRGRAAVRRAWAGVVLVVVVVGLGAGAASLYAAQAHDDLTDAQNQTLSLLQQQGQYKEVRQAEDGTALRKAAQSVGGSTEIAWKGTLGSVQSSLPDGVRITGVSIDSASPFEAYAQSDAPLQGERVATLTIDAESPTLPSVPEWLDSVKDLDGFVDATANSVTRDESAGTYTVNMTIHVDERAYDRAYDLTKGE